MLLLTHLLPLELAWLVPTKGSTAQSSSGFGASSSSKSDVAPSAPPLETRSEYESLLGKDRERPDLHQDEHKHIRWVLRQTLVDTLVENEAVLLQITACQVAAPMRA